MTKRISPYQFEDHREFVRQALKAKGFSYRSFAAKHGGVVSFITLAMTLSKGRSGTKNKPMRNFSAETLARIGKVLKLTDDEIDFLLMLKLENDAEPMPGIYGTAYLDSIRRLMRQQKFKTIDSEHKRPAPKISYTETSNTVARLIDALPASSKLRLSREILTESKAILARQSRKAGVRNLTTAIARLDELVGLGAP